MITEQLVHAIISQLRGDRNAYRIASHLAYLGHDIGAGDMNAIRDILGETHPDLRDDGKEREPVGRRAMSRNQQKKNAARHKGVPLS